VEWRYDLFMKIIQAGTAFFQKPDGTWQAVLDPEVQGELISERSGSVTLRLENVKVDWVEYWKLIYRS
jgi:hypothetical protein